MKNTIFQRFCDGGLTKTRFAWLFATCLGIGLTPVVPGTFGSLVGLAAWYFSAAWPWWGQFVAWLCVTWLAVLSAEQLERDGGRHDASMVVIDEVVGMWLACWGLPLSIGAMVLAFVAFRFFDIVKPSLIGWADRQLPGGFGVVADDVLAGIATQVVYRLALWVIGT